MVPQVISRKNDFTLLDVPDALIALEKWSGEIKVIGPISEEQVMGVGFRKDSPKLLAEFNKYFDSIKKDGTYEKMVLKYYSGVFSYYPNFFNKFIYIFTSFFIFKIIYRPYGHFCKKIFKQRVFVK